MHNSLRLVALQLIKSAQAWDPKVQQQQQATATKAKDTAARAKATAARAKATATGGKLYKDMTPEEKAQEDARLAAKRRQNGIKSSTTPSTAVGDGLWDKTWGATKAFLNGDGHYWDQVGINGMRYGAGALRGLVELPGTLAGVAGALPIGLVRGASRWWNNSDPNASWYDHFISGISDSYDDISSGVNNFNIGGYSLQNGIDSIKGTERRIANYHAKRLSEITGQRPEDFDAWTRAGLLVGDALGDIGAVTSSAYAGKGVQGLGRLGLSYLPRIGQSASWLSNHGRLGQALYNTGRFGAKTVSSAPAKFIGNTAATWAPGDYAFRLVGDKIENGFTPDITRAAKDMLNMQGLNSDRLMTNVYDYLPAQQPNMQPNTQTQPQVSPPTANQFSAYNTFQGNNQFNTAYNAYA